MTDPRVDVEVTVHWPNGERSVLAGINFPVEHAIEKLEVLVDELRAAVKGAEPEGQS